jgi:hypothetical protein
MLFNYRSIADSALRNADQAAEPSLAQRNREPDWAKGLKSSGQLAGNFTPFPVPSLRFMTTWHFE